MLRENGQYEPLTPEEMEQFERDNPEIARYWQEPDAMETLDVNRVAQEMGGAEGICDTWEQAAKRIMAKLWKVNEAWIFHKPVDPEELDIPDYFDVISHPMDFATIKNKLNQNLYKNGPQEFIDDLNLTFDNCLKYNGEESSVSKSGKRVREEFYKIYKSLSFDFYL